MEPIEVLFPKGDALAPKNGVGCGDMEEEVGHGVLKQKFWSLE
jgi:hypothetical protein